MKTTRRIFVKNGALAVASVGILPALGPLFLRSAAFAAEPQRLSKGTGGGKTLICIFQRGAVDGLSMVVPHGDPDYYQHRQVGPGGIALPNTGDGALIDLDGMFGLHPALAALKPIFDAGHLAPIQAVGSPSASRSHFDAQDFMESAAPDLKTISTGWLARALNCPEDSARLSKLFRGITMTERVPRSLMGYQEALAIPSLVSFGLKDDAATSHVDLNFDGTPGNMPPADPDGPMRAGMAVQPQDATVAAAFQAMYNTDSGDKVHGTGKEAFEAVKIIQSLHPERYVPSGGAAYPRSAFGQSLQAIAQMIKANVGVEVAFAEIGGWDTHVNQGASIGRLATDLKDFGTSLAALHADLGDRMNDVVVLTMSEFGRTVRQNGNGGTDHGHATCFLAMGGPVHGGKVLGQWPGLAPEKLYENRDLAVTTDFRDVFGEIANKHLGITDLAAVFPNYATGPAKFRGVMG